MDFNYGFNLSCPPSPMQIWGFGYQRNCGETVESTRSINDGQTLRYEQYYQDFGYLCDIRAVYLNSFRVQNEMAIGEQGSFNAQATVDLFPADTNGHMFYNRLTSGFSVSVTTYDDIRGNVDGVTLNDSVFSWHDVLVNDSLWINNDNILSLSYERYGINPARGMGYGSDPTSLDVTMMALALRHPNHPYVRNLLYGQLFSTPRPGVWQAPVHPDLSGRTLTVSTPGAIVMASTMLPNGRQWNEAATVQSGYATFTVPTDIPLEQIHVSAVSIDGVDAIDPYELPALPSSLVLNQNYPNPFNPTTMVPFELRAPTHVSLVVYDLLGRKVATLVNGNLEAGQHLARFDGTNLASGIYLCRLQTGDAIKTIKMALTK